MSLIIIVIIIVIREVMNSESASCTPEYGPRGNLNSNRRTVCVSHNFPVAIIINIIIIIIITRSYATLRAADLDWIVRPGYSSGGYI